MAEELSRNAFAKVIRVSPMTLANWEKSGKLIPARISNTGRRFYSQEQLNKYKLITSQDRILIGYSRVEAAKELYWQQSKLNSLEKYSKLHHYEFELLSDVGSLSEEREGYNTLINKVLEGKVSLILIVKEEDLAMGTELDLLKKVCNEYGTFIEVLKK